MVGVVGYGAPDELAWLGAHVAPEAVVLRVNRMEARVAAVQAGLGRAVLPDAAAERVGGLGRVPGLPSPPPCDLWLVAHRRLYQVPRVRVVWDFLAELVTTRLG